MPCSFPELADKAINAQLDLCEETSWNIRLLAIRGLPLLCKDTPVHLPKLADILGQLLLSGTALHLRETLTPSTSQKRMSAIEVLDCLLQMSPARTQK